VDKAFTDLTKAILERYHEEQVWSDKIRNVSTWANLVGLAVNLVVFIGAIAIVEPWKRKRLVARLEERIAGMMENVDLGVASLATRLDHMDQHTCSQSLPAPQLPLDPTSSTTVLPSEINRSKQSASLLPFNLPHQLDLYVAPSVERDIAVSGLLGSLGGASLVLVIGWLFGRA
jgi:sensitive to high expression protein 9